MGGLGAQLQAQPLGLTNSGNTAIAQVGGYYMEEVRRQLIDQFGEPPEPQDAASLVREHVDHLVRHGILSDATAPLLLYVGSGFERKGVPQLLRAFAAQSRRDAYLVVVGADRIAANGDAANKIGTYGVALLAKHFNIPFYVAAPLSTIDPNTSDGSGIPIEQRPDREVTHVGETRLCPRDVPVFNYAFDVTPAEYISGIITEKGVLYPPYGLSIWAALNDLSTGRSAGIGGAAPECEGCDPASGRS